MTSESSISISGIPSPADWERLTKGPYIVRLDKEESSVYWGPFDAFGEILEWVKEHGIAVQILPLNDPDGDPDEWWG